MRPVRPVPPQLLGRPFSRDEALAAGITPRQLQHDRFELLHPSVYVLRGTRLSPLARIEAARLALPVDARVSHLTRLRLLGLEYGPPSPIHFTVARDLHLAIDGIVLHRTLVMPGTDTVGVTPEAAVLGAAASLRLVDVVKIVDWLLYRGHVTHASLLAAATAEPWRPGAAGLLTAMPWTSDRARSLPETETRLLIVFAGLPEPEVNVDVFRSDGTFLGCPDLLFRWWKLLVEYEGGQHFTEDEQAESDIDRYGLFRSDGFDYVQATKRRIARPRTFVSAVHRKLVERGYDGPPPDFGRRWESLFTRAEPPPSRRR